MVCLVKKTLADATKNPGVPCFPPINVGCLLLRGCTPISTFLYGAGACTKGVPGKQNFSASGGRSLTHRAPRQSDVSSTQSGNKRLLMTGKARALDLGQLAKVIILDGDFKSAPRSDAKFCGPISAHFPALMQASKSP